MEISVFIILIVFFGLLFDYTNGFHDAANVIATVIATGVLTPIVAVLFAGGLNFIGAIQISPIVDTISSGIVQTSHTTPMVVLGGVLGAIAWNILTWFLGIPSSSSYALIGSLVGASFVESGLSHIFYKGVFYKVVLPMIFSPLLGFSLAFLSMHFIANQKKKSRLFSRLQIGSAGLVALSHGLNDAQKSMGIITLGLFAGGVLERNVVPFWVVLSCAIVMGLGTASGGMRIVKTVGFSITNLQPAQGFIAEMITSLVILGASIFGMPISSTHVIVGSIAGVGSAKGKKSVQWPVIRKILFVWGTALPGSIIMGCLFFYFIKLFC